MHKLTWRERAAILTILLLFATLLLKSDTATDASLSGMRCAVLKVIPALFPFMVLGRLLTGMAVPMSIRRLTERIFRLPGEAAMPILLGMLSGFPVGAMCTSALRHRGSVSRNDGARLLALSHNTGPAFPISYVGAVLWANRTFGLTVYLSQVVFGIALGIIMRRPNEEKTIPQDNDFSDGQTVIREKGDRDVGQSPKSRNRAVADLSRAISDSAVTCVGITGSIVMAKVLCEIVGLLIPSKFEALSAVLAAVIEFSGGAAASAALGGTVGAAITGFSVGFGGLCAFLQAADAISGSDIPMSRCLITKLCQGVLCGTVAAVYVFLNPTEIHVTVSASYTVNNSAILCAITSAILALGAVTLLCKLRRESAESRTL